MAAFPFHPVIYQLLDVISCDFYQTAGFFFEAVYDVGALLWWLTLVWHYILHTQVILLRITNDLAATMVFANHESMAISLN
jgi:hypothetical protein